MSKSAASISVLTANRLSDGLVVFLDVDGVWVEGVHGAIVARSPAEAQVLESRAASDTGLNLVVDPYLVEMQEVGGKLVPLRFRERVRLGGPSILDDVPGYVEGRNEGRRLEPASRAASHPDSLPVNGDSQRHAEAA
jgi:hypothetical protein